MERCVIIRHAAQLSASLIFCCVNVMCTISKESTDKMAIVDSELEKVYY